MSQKRYHVISPTPEILKSDKNNLLTKQNKNRLTKKTNSWLPKRKGEEGKSRSLGLTDTHDCI